MKTTSLLFSGWLIAAALSTTGLAGTVEQRITLAYICEHPKQFSVEVTKGKDGLIHFTIRRTLKEPMYPVASLTVRHEDKVIVESATLLFAGKPNCRTFETDREDAPAETQRYADIQTRGVSQSWTRTSECRAFIPCSPLPDRGL